MTKAQATKQGYSAVTFPFEPGEENMMQKVVADLKRGNITHTIVDVEGGKEVWRK